MDKSSRKQKNLTKINSMQFPVKAAGVALSDSYNRNQYRFTAKLQQCIVQRLLNSIVINTDLQPNYNIKRGRQAYH